MKSNRIKELETNEIKALIAKTNMDFDTIVNKALNHYLPRIFLVCPFTDKLCVNEKQCIGCTSSSDV